jgi:hypothetical protein
METNLIGFQKAKCRRIRPRWTAPYRTVHAFSVSVAFRSGCGIVRVEQWCQPHLAFEPLTYTLTINSFPSC